MQALTFTDSLQGLRGEAPKLWRSEHVPVRNAGEGAWVIGHVFDEYGQKPMESARNTSFSHVDDHNFIRQYWGAYLVVRYNRPSSKWFGFTDPSGHLPVYRNVFGRHVILTSHPRLFEHIGGQKATLNITAVGKHLLYPDIRQKGTCLEDIDELAPGSLMDLSKPQAASTPLWNPASFLPRGAPPSFDDACAELRHRARTVLMAWSRTLGPLSVAVSGGVDSSFICGALVEAGADFGCITLATSDASGDERAYAGLLASWINRPLVERMYQPECFSPHASASAQLPRPTRRFFLTEVDRLLNEGAKELGAEWVLDGNGGDNLFCFLHSAEPAADHIRCRGLDWAAARTILNMCQITGLDLPAMSLAVLRKLVTPARPIEFTPNDSLLRPMMSFDNPLETLVGWQHLDVGRHHGKHNHMRLIMAAQNHIHPLTCDNSRFSPLISKPILEWCLSVPTWIWAHGGINRAPARTAFESFLPVEVQCRVSKAGPDSFIRQAFSLNRQKIRELLLDGILAQHGMLDLPRIENAVSARSDDPGELIYRLLDLAEVENWARSWSQ